ncbi:MAG: zinc ribbon-containing protein [Gammaproteobacteria bacterium]|nr:zinc ribbon-containing protein [Gammaproteobacteria bacterium]
MPNKIADKLSKGYQQLLNHAEEFIVEFRHETKPLVEDSLHHAADKLEDLGELTREEVDKLRDYLMKDLYEAARYMAHEEKKLADWLRLDLAYIKASALETFAAMVDQTKLELDRLAYEAQSASWHTGEITAPGILVCDACGEELHFKEPGHIPPCPKCQATTYHRVKA